MSDIYLPKQKTKFILPSSLDELSQEYYTLLKDYKYSHGIKCNINYNKNYIFDDMSIPLMSNCIGFLVASVGSHLYECAVVITPDKQIYVLCSGDPYKGIKKVQTATSVLKLIYNLRQNNTFDFI